MNTRKIKHTVLGLVAMAATIAVQPADAQNIRLGDLQSTTHLLSINATQRWMAEVEAASEGEITFTHYPAEQAASASALLDAVSRGILDAAFIQPVYHSEQLPLWTIAGLPGLYSSASQGTDVLQQMIQSGPTRDEILATGVVPIFAVALPQYQVLSRSNRMNDLANWDNRAIRTAGATQTLVAQSLGGVAVSLPGPEVYTGVERGRLDAILFPLPSVSGYNLQEITRHISTNAGFGSALLMMIVNQSVFEGLSEEAQNLLLDVGSSVAAHAGAFQDEIEVGLTEEWAAMGVDVYTFTDEELDAINGRLGGVRQDWLDRIGRRSEFAEETLERFLSLTAD